MSSKAGSILGRQREAKDSQGQPSLPPALSPLPSAPTLPCRLSVALLYTGTRITEEKGGGHFQVTSVTVSFQTKSSLRQKELVKVMN